MLTIVCEVELKTKVIRKFSRERERKVQLRRCRKDSRSERRFFFFRLFTKLLTYLRSGYLLIHNWEVGRESHCRSAPWGTHHPPAWSGDSAPGPCHQYNYMSANCSNRRRRNFLYLISVTWSAFILSASSRSREHNIMLGFFSSYKPSSRMVSFNIVRI